MGAKWGPPQSLSQTMLRIFPSLKFLGEPNGSESQERNFKDSMYFYNKNYHGMIETSAEYMTSLKIKLTRIVEQCYSTSQIGGRYLGLYLHFPHILTAAFNKALLSQIQSIYKQGRS